MPKNMGAASTLYLVDLWWMEHTQKETLTLHTWLLHKSPSVGENGESLKFHIHQRPSLLKNDDDVNSTLLIKKEEK
jgi:hypothetical protein